MATITQKSTNDASVRLGSTPWGNLAALTYTLETDSSGVVIGGDAAAAPTTSDVVNIGVIPAGFTLTDFKAVVRTAMTSTATLTLGFAYVDGVNSTAVPQDDDYFAAAAASTAGVLRQTTTVKQVTLPKDAYLTLKIGTLANAKAAAVDFTVFAVATGA